MLTGKSAISKVEQHRMARAVVMVRSFVHGEHSH